MAKNINIKLTGAGQNIGPFNIYDEFRNLIAENVSRSVLINGITVEMVDEATSITLESIEGCPVSKTKALSDITQDEYYKSEFQQTFKACLWRHLTDPVHYNFFYGFVEPYIIEYPFAYQYLDEIVQNIQDHTKVYEYTRDPDNVFTETLRVQPDDRWFNKAVLYNDQQSSGLLILEPKPKNNLQSYNIYPKYNPDSKIILYTKSDNFYQYNTFWNIVKDPMNFLFKQTCTSLSYDKIINQDNMDYGMRSYKKAALRAKHLKVRHILDNSSTTHLVSQFIVGPTMNSYK
jgi:hypothetical protein